MYSNTAPKQFNCTFYYNYFGTYFRFVYVLLQASALAGFELLEEPRILEGVPYALRGKD